MPKRKAAPGLPLITGCQHHSRSNLGYIQSAEDAEMRLAAGEKQTQCPTCKLWLWPHEVGYA